MGRDRPALPSDRWHGPTSYTPYTCFHVNGITCFGPARLQEVAAWLAELVPYLMLLTWMFLVRRWLRE